jgi:cell division protein ZapA
MSFKQIEEYIASLQFQLNQMLGELQSRHHSVAMTDALVLTCFNLLDQNSKAEASADHIRGQLTEYLQDAARARIELEDANREIARLRAELDRAYHR